MAWIKYPYHVTHNGIKYAPNTLIEVEDAQYFVAQGATEVVTEDAPKATPAEQPKRRGKKTV